MGFIPWNRKLFCRLCPSGERGGKGEEGTSSCILYSFSRRLEGGKKELLEVHRPQNRICVCGSSLIYLLGMIGGVLGQITVI